MKKMKVKVIINGKELTADSSWTILETALENEIFIPNLCFDKRLKPFGSCRLCLVEVKDSKNFQTACSTKVYEGMVVETETERLKEIRKTILDLILSDHDLNCITCERTGSCQLQDLAYEYSIENVRFEGEKRSYITTDNNPVIERDYRKCILCGRCVRICDEVQGVNAIDFIGRGFHTAIDTPFHLQLLNTTCEFCGQCISTCPTGAIVDKPGKNRGRIWQLKKTRTICGYCGCGCTIDLHVRNGTVVGVSAPIDEGVNKGNLCAKGRFGYSYINHPERLKTPLIKKNGRFIEVTWKEAINTIATKLLKIKKEHGPDSIASLASAKCTNEDNYLFQKFMRAVIGTNNVDVCARL